MMRSRSRAVTVLAALSAVGLILGYIESFIVIPVNIPGFKIGTANIVSVIALYLFGAAQACVVMLIRTILSALLFGSPISLVYSLFGGLVALTAMYFGKRLGFSVYGTSILGAVFHNIAQTAAAFVFVGNIYVFTYVPILVIAAVFTGTLTGFLSDVLIKRLGRIFTDERKQDK